MLNFCKEYLILLVVYLRTLPDDYDRFDMGHFYAPEEEDGLRENSIALSILSLADNKAPPCGTVACLLGHAPAAGVPIGGLVNWFDYMRTIAVGYHEDYLFSCVWENYNNTVQGGIYRIERILGGFNPGDEHFPWNEEYNGEPYE